MPYADLPEVRLSYTDEGSGTPLLLVHGWGGDGRAWNAVRFTGYRVITVDLRGHGRSSVPDHGYRPLDYAEDLAALVRLLELPPVVAIGHSMAGQIVSVLAIEHPALVRALVAIDPAYGADDAEASTFERRLADLQRDGAAAAALQLGDLSEAVRDQLLATPGHVLAQSYEGMYLSADAFGARVPAERYLAKRSHPVLCVRPLPEMGRWDATVPAPRGSRVVVWEGTGHFLHQERPEDFSRLVESWLRIIGI